MIAKINLKEDTREYVKGFFGSIITFNTFASVTSEVRRLNNEVKDKENVMYIPHYEPLH